MADKDYYIRYWKQLAEANQAKIDALMLEYCPDDMTDDQWQRWTKSQEEAIEVEQ